MAKIVCIGGSTGAPVVLADLVAALPAEFRSPVLVALHMPAAMTEHFARTLSAKARRKVALAVTGGRPEAGVVYLAPGGQHLGLSRGGQVIVTPRPAETAFKPSIDVLFLTVSQAVGPEVVAVVLTGLSAGRDAVEGSRAVKAAGGQVLVIDDPASRFLGMPKGVIDAGAATRVARFAELPKALLAVAG